MFGIIGDDDRSQAQLNKINTKLVKPCDFDFSDEENGR